jgi:hypothetical protein
LDAENNQTIRGFNILKFDCLKLVDNP